MDTKVLFLGTIFEATFSVFLDGRKIKENTVLECAKHHHQSSPTSLRNLAGRGHITSPKCYRVILIRIMAIRSA